MTGGSTHPGPGRSVVHGGHDVRLAPAVCVSWAGAWWATGSSAGQVRGVAVALLVAGAVAAVVGAVVRPSSRPPRRWLSRGDAAGVAAVTAVVVTGCACAGAVLVLTAWQLERRAPDVVTDLADGRRAASVVLTVSGDPLTGRGQLAWQREQVRVRVVLEAVHGPAGEHRVRVPALLSGDRSWSGVRWGERVRVPVRLAPAPDGAPYTVFVRAVGPALDTAEPRWWWRGAERLRSGLLVASGADGTSDAAGLLPGLVVGDTSRLPVDLEEDMRTAGLTHLTAVSGANITIVCGGVVLLCVLLRVGHRGAAVLAGVALVGLVVVARPEPSVLRAAVMGSVGLVGLLLGRRGGGLSALLVAVVVVLLADPWLARAPGFRLSVLATGALVLCSMPWARALGRVLPRPVAVAVAVPAAAQAAVTPVLVGLDPVVSLYALPANVLAAPAVAPATVIGLLAALVSLVHPAPAAALALPARWCAGWIAGVARGTADLPAASLPWPGGATGVAAAAVAGLLLLAVTAVALRVLPDRRPSGSPWAAWPRLPTPSVASQPSAGPRSGRWRALLSASVVLALAAVWLLPRSAGGGWPGPDWSVVVCDVGQGESVLVRTGPRSAVVLDTGPDPAGAQRCLRGAGVTTVPLLVLSHLHADHVGGLEGVARQARVDRVWSAPTGMPATAEERLRDWAVEHGAVLERPVAGQSTVLQGTQVDVLAPTAGRGDPAAPGEELSSQDVNDAGLVVRLDTGHLVVLALGDIGSQVQQGLLHAGRPIRADVTTVAHHGSADQLPALYAAVGAEVAVASAGRDNTYGHPSPRAVAVVEAAGTRVLSTAVHGGVALRTLRSDDGAVVIAVRTTRARPRHPSAVPA